MQMKIKKIDIWFEDNPIDIMGQGGSSYPNVIHIDTINEDNEYVEDVDGEILFLNEMDKVMVNNVIKAIETA